MIRIEAIPCLAARLVSQKPKRAFRLPRTVAAARSLHNQLASTGSKWPGGDPNARRQLFDEGGNK